MNKVITRRNRILLLTLLPLCTLLGCQHSPHGSGNSSDSQIQLAFVTNATADFWTLCRKGTEKAEKDLPGVNVRFVMPDDGTAATQKRDIDDLLAKGVKGIAISVVDPTNETPYLNEIAAKTNLITSDSDAASSRRLCYIGTDNHAAGLMAGQLIKEAIPQGGKIMLFVGKRDAQSAHDREQGIRDALKSSNVQVVDVRTDDADHARAKANVADALVKYPDLSCLVGLWSYNAPAILSALQDAGKVGKVKIVAFDQEQDTLNGIKAGAIYGTIVQQPFEFGYQAVTMLAQLARGDKSHIPASKLIIIPTQAIKQGSLAAYQAQQTKLLGGV